MQMQELPVKFKRAKPFSGVLQVACGRIAEWIVGATTIEGSRVRPRPPLK